MVEMEQVETINCEECDEQMELPTSIVEQMVNAGVPIVCSGECYDRCFPG